jgi:hypothetical protein
MAGRVTHYGNVVRDGLVLHLDAAKKDSYPGSGTVWNDLSGNGNNGTLINGPTFSNQNGGSVVFDGINDMSTIPYNSNLNLCNIPKWTISVWMKITDNLGSVNCIIGQWQQLVEGDAWLLSHTNGVVGFAWAPLTAVTNMFESNTPLIVNQWYNIVLVKDGSNFSLYQNTINVGSFINAGTKNVSYRIELGRYGFSASYIGAQYSTVTIQHKALTPQEIQRNYETLRGRYGI